MRFQNKTIRPTSLMALFLILLSGIAYGAIADLAPAIYLNSIATGPNWVLSGQLNGTESYINVSLVNTTAAFSWNLTLLNVTYNSTSNTAGWQPACTNASVADIGILDTNLGRNSSVYCNMSNLNMADGNFSLNVSITNSSGAVNSTVITGIMIDNSAPEITINTSLNVNNTWFGSESGPVVVPLNWTVADRWDNGTTVWAGGLNCTVKLFNKTTVNAGNTIINDTKTLNNTLKGYGIAFTASNGTYNYTLNCSDWAANSVVAPAAGTEYMFTVDSIDPEIRFITLNTTRFNSSSISLHVNVTDNLASTMTCNISVGAGGTWNKTGLTFTNNTANSSINFENMPYGEQLINMSCWDQVSSQVNKNNTHTAMYVNISLPRLYTYNGTNTTNLSAVTNTSKVPQLTIANTVGSQIKWSGNVNAMDASLNDEITMKDGVIHVNSSKLDTSFNATAEVAINLSKYIVTNRTNCPLDSELHVAYYGLEQNNTFNGISENGVDCVQAGHCSAVTCSGGILRFTVNSFSGYAALGNSNLTTHDNAPILINNMVKINASFINRTNSTDILNTTFPHYAACFINFTTPNIGGNLTSMNMNYNSDTKVYEHNVTLINTPATVYYNITCNASGFTTLAVLNQPIVVSQPEVAAYSGGSGGGGSGGGGPSGATISVPATAVGVAFTSYTYDNLKVSVDGLNYALKVTKAYAGAKADLKLGNAVFSINVGETKQVDLNGDSVQDVEVTLNSASVNKVQLVVKEITVKAEAPKPMATVKKETVKKEETSMPVAAAADDTGASEPATTNENPSETNVKTGSGTIAAVVIAVLIVLGGVYFFLNKKQPQP